MVHQRNFGFVGSFDTPWSEKSELIRSSQRNAPWSFLKTSGLQTPRVHFTFKYPYALKVPPATKYIVLINSANSTKTWNFQIRDWRLLRQYKNKILMWNNCKTFMTALSFIFKRCFHCRCNINYSLPKILPILITLPRAFFTSGRKVCVTSMVPQRLTSAIPLKLSNDYQSTIPTSNLPALFMSPHNPTDVN